MEHFSPHAFGALRLRWIGGNLHSTRKCSDRQNLFPLRTTGTKHSTDYQQFIFGKRLKILSWKSWHRNGTSFPSNASRSFWRWKSLLSMPGRAHPGYSNAQAPPFFCAPLFSEVQYISASVFLAFTFVLLVLMLESGYTQRQVKFRLQEDMDITAAAIAGSSIAFFMYCIFV